MAISLIFLAILSLVGLYAMRSSILGEQVSKNIRSNEIAAQAAETALRYCEDQVRTNQAITILPESLDQSGMPTAWQTRANWFNNSISVEVPASQLAATGMRPLPVLPRCIIERMSLPPAPGEDPRAVSFMRPHLVTAVGFSADYERDSSNRAISGGEVWLQSFLIR
ncbi:PilX N-terminal domain-containing pilus assembly protein [Diaphorobacter sp. LR2014-1]|uniref:pilus assembly PilX family protein n=1 Tax=Diaphorobacter sp. LR2014-1 TaxID=1933219 RepID=UPI00155DE421|nr:PilX N-terminal domain-containing pilus assembly protein [Diaphorobacter sp. LR2014-1]